MKRLRHPITSIREPFGKAGLTVAILALVMAMVGGAYAAAKLNSTQKKEVEKIAKKFAGKPGAAGATGPAGANGTNGTNGAPGKEGLEGKQGLEGKEGKQGKEGKEGIQGKEGSPWPAGGTLPAGKTETGTYAISATGEEQVESAAAPLSFAIPLASPLDESHVHFVGAGAEAGTGKGDLTFGSTVIKNVVTQSGKFTDGSTISGAGIPPGTLISEVIDQISETKLIITKAATATGTAVPLTAGIPAACPGNIEAPAAASGNLCVYGDPSGQLAGFALQILKPDLSLAEEGAGKAGAFFHLTTVSGVGFVEILGGESGTFAVTG
jgi:hypothetical protein